MLPLDMSTKRFDARDLGNIAADGVDAVSDVLRRGIERRLIATGDDDLCAFACEQLGCRQSHSRAAASDNSDLPVQLTHIRLLIRLWSSPPASTLGLERRRQM
jgi:hypothetical protein